MTFSDRVYQTQVIQDRVSEEDYAMFHESKLFSAVDIFPS